MPIEVKELIIKALASRSSQGNSEHTKPADKSRAEDEIIQACIDIIAEIIRERKDR